jgi:hypothetical protein
MPVRVRLLRADLRRGETRSQGISGHRFRDRREINSSQLRDYGLQDEADDVVLKRSDEEDRI